MPPNSSIGRHLAKYVPLVLIVFLSGMLIEELSQIRMANSFQKLTINRDVLQSTYSSLTTETPFHLKKYDLLPAHYQRKQRIKEVCKSTIHGYIGNSSESLVNKNIVVDQKHRIIYCEIQKIGSTFLTSLLRKVSSKKIGILEKEDDTNFATLHKLKNYEFAELHALMKNSFKFMFVRDPYQRLLSGYVDKLYSANTLYWGFAKNNILPLVRKNIEGTPCGSDITFPEFIKYVIMSETLGKHRDRHFTPIYEHCRPCQMDYDFIGKMETFKQDTELLLNTWNSHFHSNIMYDDFEAETALARVQSKIGQVFSMRKGIVPCISMYKALQRTWHNLQIRGLISKHIGLPVDINEINNLTADEVKQRAAKMFENQTEDMAMLKLQKKESFLEAYSMVSSEDLVKLSQVLQTDCDLFGYECAPDTVFIQSRSISLKNQTYKYFDFLH